MHKVGIIFLYKAFKEYISDHSKYSLNDELSLAASELLNTIEHYSLVLNTQQHARIFPPLFFLSSAVSLL